MEPKDEIKQKLDIAEFISEYLELKPASVDSLRGLCPFHDEKTPSFNVSKDKQVWHCFGCGEGGDIFSFVMKMENVDFTEALQLLGKKAGVEIKRFNSEKSNQKQNLMAVNDLAARYYRKVLVDATTAAEARSYIDSRKIPVEMAEKFSLGFAPDRWDSLVNFFEKRGVPSVQALSAGLIVKKKSGRGFIDRFRNRLMIPLKDQHGNTVGFTGRIMPGADEKAGAKYMNSPETPVYKKGELLYGLDLAKKAIKHEGCVIIVEGNLDVIASHKAGVENIVASSGTALTESQLILLKRYTETIVFCFDADAAGIKAAEKGIALARHLEIDVRVIVLPEEAGKDPDEAIQKDPKIWLDAVKNTVPIMRYFVDLVISGKDLSKVDDKRAVAKILLPKLAEITDVVEREHWLQVLADLLRIEIQVLRQSIVGSPTPPKKHVGSPTPPKLHKKTKNQRAFILLFGIAVQDDQFLKRVISNLEIDLLPEGDLRDLYKALKLEYDSVESSQPAQKSPFLRIRERLEVEAVPLMKLLTEASFKAEQAISDMSQGQVQGQIDQLVGTILSSDKKRQRKALEIDIRQAELDGDHSTVKRLIRELSKLR